MSITEDDFGFLTFSLTPEELQDLRDWANEHNSTVEDMIRETLKEAIVR